ncbi:MAG: aspartate ammonia-lyase [Erysipelotrichaceae bacterium]
MIETRTEKDSIGEIEVPINALYGCQTVRAMHNFPITHLKTHPIMIRSLGMVKKACAIANHECGHLEDEKFDYIITACDEVIAGKLDEWFITDVIQGGAGTSVNMNANEVIANRAAQLAGKPIGVYDYIHPNDHINFGQSTNDVFPTAGKLTCLYLVENLLEEVMLLQEALLDKSIEFNDVMKLGRTHLQDAVPIRMGQEFHAFATSFVRDIRRIKLSFANLKSINMGATAIGTGINTDEQYRRICVIALCEISQIDLTSARDLVDGTRNVDTFAWAHASLKTLAVNLSKMCNDIRLMASGPKTGLAEIGLPPKQPGSSIMPGKINPVIPEVCNQVCFQVFGNDIAITKAAEAGQMELNVFEPVLFYNLFQSIEILANACYTLRENAIKGIVANREHCKDLVENSLGTATALAPHIGYANASKYAKMALKDNRKLKELILESKLMTKEKLDEVLNIKEMTSPGIPGMHKKRDRKKG